MPAWVEVGDRRPSSIEEDHQGLGWVGLGGAGGEAGAEGSLQVPGPVLADPAAQCVPVPGVGEGAAVRGCVGGPEPPPLQPLFLNFQVVRGRGGGGGPRPAGWPSRPSQGPATPHLSCAWIQAYLGVRRHPALHVGRSPWLRRHWGSWGLSGGGGGGQRPGQGFRGASRPARPGGQDSEAGALRGRSEPARLVACEARSRRAPGGCWIRQRSRSLPGAGPVPAAAQPYCTAGAGPGLPAGAYQVRRGEVSASASKDRAAARPLRAPRPASALERGPSSWGRLSCGGGGGDAAAAGGRRCL